MDSCFLSPLPSEARRNGELGGSDFTHLFLILNPAHTGQLCNYHQRNKKFKRKEIGTNKGSFRKPHVVCWFIQKVERQGEGQLNLGTPGGGRAQRASAVSCFVQSVLQQAAGLRHRLGLTGAHASQSDVPSAVPTLVLKMNQCHLLLLLGNNSRHCFPAFRMSTHSKWQLSFPATFQTHQEKFQTYQASIIKNCVNEDATKTYNDRCLSKIHTQGFLERAETGK